MVNLSDVIPSLFINKYASFLQLSSQGLYRTMIALPFEFLPLFTLLHNTDNTPFCYLVEYPTRCPH